MIILPRTYATVPHRNSGAVMMRKYGDEKWTDISKDNIKYN